MLNIAILGFGVVGGGVADLITTNSEEVKRLGGDEIYIKHILDLRDFPESPFADRVTKDFDKIISDCKTAGFTQPETATELSKWLFDDKTKAFDTRAEYDEEKGTFTVYMILPAQYDEKGKLVERAVNYIADFTYNDENGLRVVEDAKGMKTKEYIIKRKLMLHIHGIRIKEV